MSTEKKVIKNKASKFVQSDKNIKHNALFVMFDDEWNDYIKTDGTPIPLRCAWRVKDDHVNRIIVCSTSYYTTDFSMFDFVPQINTWRRTTETYLKKYYAKNATSALILDDNILYISFFIISC